MMIFITGVSGSGKTTISKLVANELGLWYFSSGDYIRQLIENGDKESGVALKDGKLAPRENELRSQIGCRLYFKDGCVVDGYPRSASQFKWIRDDISKRCKTLICVIGVGRDKALERLEKRKREPLQVAEQAVLTQQLNFDSWGNDVKTFNGEQSIEKIKEEVLKWIKENNSKKN